MKAGGAIPAKGKKVTVSVKDIRDLSRDVIKVWPTIQTHLQLITTFQLLKTSKLVFQSDTASVIIPEIDLELTSGTLGGIVTTVEGLVTKISEGIYFPCSII